MLQLAVGCTINGTVSAQFVNSHRFRGTIGNDPDNPDVSFNFSADVLSPDGQMVITGTYADTDPVSCLGATGQFTMIPVVAGPGISAESENRRTIHWWILDGSGELPADERSGKIVLGRQ